MGGSSDRVSVRHLEGDTESDLGGLKERVEGSSSSSEYGSSIFTSETAVTNSTRPGIRRY